ncbi:hypothetical protein HY733_03940, partial [Candidatus Uhrbacteria bacterium]|nr:hypothetical protein [Candidatus Uhrbacteria bacterium]
WLTETELVSRRIRKDEPMSSREVFDLRRYVTLLRGAKRHEQNLRDREERQRQWEERNGSPSRPPSTPPRPRSVREELMANPLISDLLRRVQR